MASVDEIFGNVGYLLVGGIAGVYVKLRVYPRSKTFYTKCLGVVSLFGCFKGFWGLIVALAGLPFKARLPEFLCIFGYLWGFGALAITRMHMLELPKNPMKNKYVHIVAQVICFSFSAYWFLSLILRIYGVPVERTQFSRSIGHSLGFVPLILNLMVLLQISPSVLSTTLNSNTQVKRNRRILIGLVALASTQVWTYMTLQITKPSYVVSNYINPFVFCNYIGYQIIWNRYLQIMLKTQGSQRNRKESSDVSKPSDVAAIKSVPVAAAPDSNRV